MSHKADRKTLIYLVSGKGGVGKSTIAAAIGHQFASQGLKTLLIELGQNSYFDYVFEQKFTFQPKNLFPNLDLAIWSGEECLKEFIAYYIRLTSVVDLFFENKIMKTLVRAAPALQELAILGKLTSNHRKIGPEMDYDRIVLDAYSSGHFLSLLRVPKGMAEAISLGPMGQQSESIHKVLIDPHSCKHVWVTTCEELPVQESLEFMGVLHREFNVEPLLILNKVLSHQMPKTLPQDTQAFTNFVQNIRRQEDWSFEQFQRSGLPFVEFPFDFEASIEKRIQSLAKVIVNNEAFV